MSAFYFTTRTRVTSLPGTERARAMRVIGEITGRVLGLDTERGSNRAVRILPEDYHPFVRMLRAMDRETRTPFEEFANWSAMSAIMGGAELCIIPGPRFAARVSVEKSVTQSAPETVLNTAIAHGSEAEVLLARISGSVKHGLLVPAEDRMWLAGVITTGVGPGGPLEQQAQRWIEVARHLADVVADPGPALLACSQGYSVSDLAANAAGIPDIADAAAREEAWEAWEGVETVDQWDRWIDGIAADRTDKPWLVLTPATFRDKNYAQGYCAADAVREHDAWWKRNVTDQLHRVSDFYSPAERVQNAGRARPAAPDSPTVIYPAADEVGRDFIDWLHGPKGRVSRQNLAREAANASRAGRRIVDFTQLVAPTIEDRDFDPLPPGSDVVSYPIRGVYRNSDVGRRHIVPGTEAEDQP